MPRKRKDKENVIPSSSETELPKTFRDLTALTNVQLNGLLRVLDLPLKQKRNHKLTVVANYLNIPTVGENGEQDPFLQTLSDVKSMTDGWTGDMRQVPDIRLDSILGYLQAAHDIAATNHQGDIESYTSVSLRTYRALRAYDMWESGHISGYKFNKLCDIDRYCAVKCVANPSGDTSGTQYDVVVIFKDCGSPIGGSCTCVAGLGEACTHIGGLMFGMDEFVSRGFKQLPDCESTTEKLCRWNVPRGPKVVPTQLSNVTVRKNVPGKVKKDKTFCASRYNPLPEEKHSLDYEKLTQLHHALGIVNPNLPWVKAVAPAIIAEHRPPLVISPTPPPVASSLPDIVPFDHHVNVPAYTCEVETNLNPPSLTDKIKVTRDPELTRDSIKYSVDESDKIEQITREQSCSSLWYKYRRGIITSSNFQQVDSHINVIKTKGPTSATNNIIDNLIKGSKFKGNKATRYGQQQEPRAVVAYWESQSDQHTNFIIKES